MEEKLNKLLLLPKFRDNPHQLKVIYGLDVGEDTKSSMIDVLYKDHEEDVKKAMSEKSKKLHVEHISKEIRKFYDGAALRGTEGFYTLNSKLPSYLSIDSGGMSDAGRYVRMTEQTLAFFTQLYVEKKERVSESVQVDINDVIPKVYKKPENSTTDSGYETEDLDEEDDLGEDGRPEMVEYDINGFTVLWNKQTNELLDPDDGEIMGNMVKDGQDEWKPVMNDLDDLDDSDDSDDSDEE